MLRMHPADRLDEPRTQREMREREGRIRAAIAPAHVGSPSRVDYRPVKRCPEGCERAKRPGGLGRASRIMM